MQMKATLYALVGGSLLALYAAHGFFGVDLFASDARDELPQSVRQTPGGYRTFIFWNSGYQGGK